MSKTNFKTLIFSIILIIFLFVGWQYFEGTSNPENSYKELDILHQIFKDSSILVQENSQYQITGDDKIAHDVVDNTPVKAKQVVMNLLDIDLDQNGQDEIVALVALRFLGRVCTSCMSKFYITVLATEDNQYVIKHEQELEQYDELWFFSDIILKKAELLDLNQDGLAEIQVTYSADSFVGLNKEIVAILQWQKDQFQTIWQQSVHMNMDNYGRLPEEDKQNYDATFSLQKSDNTYPDIIVRKAISKEKGIVLPVMKIENITYKWNGEEYYLWEEELVEER